MKPDGISASEAGAVRCSPRLVGILVVLVVILAAMILTAEPYADEEMAVSSAAHPFGYPNRSQKTTIP